MTRPTYEVSVDWDNDGDFDDAGETLTDVTATVDVEGFESGTLPTDSTYGTDVEASSSSPITGSYSMLTHGGANGWWVPNDGERWTVTGDFDLNFKIKWIGAAGRNVVNFVVWGNAPSSPRTSLNGFVWSMDNTTTAGLYKLTTGSGYALIGSGSRIPAFTSDTVYDIRMQAVGNVLHFDAVRESDQVSLVSTSENVTSYLDGTHTTTGFCAQAVAGIGGSDGVRIDEIGYATASAAAEDRVLARSPIVIQYGRDQARTLSPMAPGRATLEVSNTSGDYSPDRSDSPLYGLVKPGRLTRIQATHSAVTYSLFHGYLDDFDVLPDVEERSVSLSAVDALARFRGRRVTTGLYQWVRTGDAIGYLLDALDWPSDRRDLDPGASYLPWWWEENSDAFDALRRLLQAEGPPALITVGGDGAIVFRDRHHRLLRADSLTSQATFRGSGTEPTMATSLVYDHGWRDIVNSVTVAVPRRVRDDELSDVWESDALYSITGGDTQTITASTSDPFTGAVVPEEDVDYVVESGSVTVTLSRTEGASLSIFIAASGGAAVVRGMKVRAYSAPVVATTLVKVEDTGSIAEHGERSYPDDVPWVGMYDALAVGQVILGLYAERRPTVTMRVVGGHDTRHAQQLGRDLSDRVTIIETETGLNADFHIEAIQHRTDGISHETVFGLERAPEPTAGNPFTFNETGAGFNDGVFAQVGLDDPDTVFTFDENSSGHRFDEGLFAT